MHAAIMAIIVLCGNQVLLGEVMLDLRIEEIGELAVIECQGRIVKGEAAFKLREVVLSLRNVRTILLDLSELSAIEGGGLGILLFLKRWASDHNIQLKLFNPILCVRNRLDSAAEFDIATVRETMALLARADNSLAVAA
jgi:anti-anti-sigma regulatory factor